MIGINDKKRAKAQEESDLIDLSKMRGFAVLIKDLERQKLSILSNLNQPKSTELDNNKDIGRLLQIEYMLDFYNQIKNLRINE